MIQELVITMLTGILFVAPSSGQIEGSHDQRDWTPLSCVRAEDLHAQRQWVRLPSGDLVTIQPTILRFTQLRKHNEYYCKTAGWSFLRFRSTP